MVEIDQLRFAAQCRRDLATVSNQPAGGDDGTNATAIHWLVVISALLVAHTHSGDTELVVQHTAATRHTASGFT